MSGGVSTVGRAVSSALAAAALLLFAGCATKVTLLPEPLDCPVAPELLAQRCADPEPLADGATYEQVLRAGGRDRDALRQCALHDRALATAITACNEAIARHREALRAINREAAAAR